MTSRPDDPASLPDDENPEWTLEDFRNSRPALPAIAEIFGQEMADFLRQLGAEKRAAASKPNAPEDPPNPPFRLTPAFRACPRWRSRASCASIAADGFKPRQLTAAARPAQGGHHGAVT
jgi:hypothetical protein